MLRFELSTGPKLPNLEEDILVLVSSRGSILYDESNNNILFSINDPLLNNKILKEKLIYIGKLDDTDVYAFEIPSFHKENMSFVHGIQLLDKVNPELHTLTYRSLQLLNWDRTSQFCSCCGSKTNLSKDEFLKVCSESKCNHFIFPQYSPAVLMLITRGDEILLGRSYHFDKGVYSTLAGYIESGESCEEAVRREVREEVGIQVKNIQYHSVQPWPFPNVLMIAFTSEYASGDLTVDTKELEDAQWFNIDKLPKLPIASSVASQLINEFVHTRKQHKYGFVYSSYLSALLCGGLSGGLASAVALPFRYITEHTSSNSFEGTDRIKKFCAINYVVRIALNTAGQSASYLMFNKLYRDFSEKSDYPHLPWIQQTASGYFSGLLTSTIFKVFERKAPDFMLKFIKKSDSVLSNKHFLFKMHHEALFASSFLAIYPKIKQEIAGCVQNPFLLVLASCASSSAMYISLLLPTTLIQSYKKESAVLERLPFNLQNIKKIVGQSMRHTLWRAPVIGLAGEISLRFMQNQNMSLSCKK